MTFTCPDCNKSTLLEHWCYHRHGKYNVFYYEKQIGVWADGKYILQLKNIRRLDESIIDKLLLLK